MLNIFRMDLHRFITNKIMYILLLVFCAFQIFGIFMFKQYTQPIQAGGIDISKMNESEFIQHLLSQPPSWILIYIFVFCVYFYFSEYNSGFYKNYITMKKARVYSVVSKILIQAIFTVFMMVAMVVSDLIGRGIFFDNTSIGDLGYFVKLLIGLFLLLWAFSILILCTSIFTRSMLVSLGIALVLVLNVVGMILAALESLLDNVYLSQYLLVSTIYSTFDYNHGRDLVHIASVATVTLLLFAFIAIRLKIKEDLR